MRYEERLNRWLSSNWIGDIPMPTKRDFGADKKALAQDCHNVGKSVSSVLCRLSNIFKH